LEEQANELRRIRITLIFLVIIILFTSGNSDVQVDYPDGDFGDVSITQQNIVQLGEGRFGVLEYGNLEIYEYDPDHNKVKKVKTVLLEELEP
jgi:hypothetical protein